MPKIRSVERKTSLCLAKRRQVVWGGLDEMIETSLRFSSGKRREIDAEILRIASLLERDVIFGRLQPGDRLVEERIAAEHGVKRHIVRAALVELQRMDIVERRPNRGAVVKIHSEAEIAELFQFRADLHRLAVAQLTFPWDAKRLAELKEVAQEHEHALETNDQDAAFDSNTRFHCLIFDCCGNRFLAQTIRRHAWLSHSIGFYQHDPAHQDRSNLEHAQMVSMIEAGDREGLAALAVNHIEPTAHRH